MRGSHFGILAQLYCLIVVDFSVRSFEQELSAALDGLNLLKGHVRLDRRYKLHPVLKH